MCLSAGFCCLNWNSSFDRFMGLSPFHTLAPELFASPRPLTPPPETDSCRPCRLERLWLVLSLSPTPIMRSSVPWRIMTAPIVGKDASVWVFPPSFLCVSADRSEPHFQQRRLSQLYDAFIVPKGQHSMFIWAYYLIHPFQNLYRTWHLTLLCALIGETLSLHAGAHPSGASE